VLNDCVFDCCELRAWQQYEQAAATTSRDRVFVGHQGCGFLVCYEFTWMLACYLSLFSLETPASFGWGRWVWGIVGERVYKGEEIKCELK